ncbi:carbohydrate kinase [Dinoroseobacter shibae DFL 12 = DSM 16493]|jgi:fructokinase|uniref:Carbohydrate kinase n=1 Tax=Dinoroseobacter shibae (strain DSM 16493 / NCIMB 14021 / DFL 12) TaxID=398580 RepID=A8LJ35_DINSH|nr:carbohydrate kinase [Dinoroseobacter shibae]ABV94530.1 carbohydrate kinase [Dinoroseobacter shibae DFL 12 = DSM 16493]URF45957.1 carbohydrate kinase [Dinoroseobacter shibae]URF50263.1 carbohydrate kinase [Dinoroseobacter shibae]
MILCAGEALIDMLPRALPDGTAGFAPVAGGAVFNTAVALGRLGADVGLVTGLSRDLFGEVLMTALAAADVDSDMAVLSDRPTTLAFVTLTDGHAQYAFYDENTAGRMLAPADMPDPGPEVGTLFFGGISLAVEPCAAAYEALCLKAAAGRVVMLDPNIRPGFIKDETTFRARIDRMLAVTDIVKVSDEDLAWLMGPGDLAESAAALRARGPAVVCVTRGGAGVEAHTATGITHVAAEAVEVVDTVGAGDTFNAGFLAGLAEAGALDKDRLRALDAPVLTSALRLGAQAAAITVSRAGANPPWRDELPR